MNDALTEGREAPPYAWASGSIEWLDRYRVERRWFRWRVMCGTGTRPAGVFWRRVNAERYASVLRVAFADGLYVGENKLCPRDVYLT